MKTPPTPSAASPCTACVGARQRGFTLIELIMVMVILGVLAVFAAPRMFNNDDFYARGFHDETLALLRYAQKTAIAQRRTVCVSFPTASTATLTMAKDPSTANCVTPTTTALIGPNGLPTIIAKSPVTYSVTTPPTAFNFDGLGRPITGWVDATGQSIVMATQTIKINNSSDVIVEASTGYVHD